MKKLFLAFCFLPVITAAQNFHFSGRLGLANYRGDLNEKNITLSQARLMGLLGVQYRIFTDYLDDVSNIYIDQASLPSARGPKVVQLAYRGNEAGAGAYPAAGVSRGNPNNKDGYYYSNYLHVPLFFRQVQTNSRNRFL